MTQEPEGEKRKILIIEDNKINRNILSAMLSGDYRILEAENGLQGVECLQRYGLDISLIILDIHMPVMEGHEFLTIVKADPYLKNIPVVIATGNSSKEEEERCLNLGATDFIVKPYNLNIIKSRIKNIIALRESATAISAIEFDELTGVYTRQAFIHHAGLVLKRNPEKRYSLVISDIDDFKMINEQFGEAYGDRMLTHGASFIRPAIQAGIPVGRYGGDQFVMLLEYDPETANNSGLEEAIEGIKKSFPVPGLELRMGIYNDVDHNLPVSVLCDRAKLAARSINHQYGKHIAFYDESLREKQNFLKKIELDMQKAYEEEQFKVFYQPKHDAATEKLVGAEALIRWEHPELGMLSPAAFIDQFEKNGFISHADFYVWKRTCMNLRKWMDQGISVVPVSVNSSRRDYKYPDYLEKLKEPLGKYNIAPSLLHIEVTESLFAQNPAELGERIRVCREAGFKIELDDFGTGYSSLNILSELPLDVMKLDRSFIKKIHDRKKSEILSCCISLAKALGLTTIAEGVETEEERNILLSMGCDSIQGYYYSKPLSEADFEQYMLRCAEKTDREKKQ